MDSTFAALALVIAELRLQVSALQVELQHVRDENAALAEEASPSPVVTDG